MKKIKSFIIIFSILFSSTIKLNSNTVGLSFLEFIFLFTLFYDLLINRFVYRGAHVKLIFTIIILQFISLFLLFNFDSIRLLYALRFLEYFLIGYFIWRFYRDKITNDLLQKIFFVTTIIFLFFKTFNNTYLPFSYVWEASTFFSLFGVFFYDVNKNLKGQILFFLCFFLVFYTNQRTPMIAMLIVYFYSEIIKNKNFFLPSIIFISTTFVGYQFIENNRLWIFINSFSLDNIILAANIAYENATSASSYNDFVYGTRSVLTDGGDLSLHLRFKKWAYAFFEMNNPIRFLLGNGPGYFGGAADSSILRIFFETGLVGVIIWFIFLYKLVRKKYTLLIFCVIINSLFIDTFYSSKVTFLTLLLILFYENRTRVSSLQQ